MALTTPQTLTQLVQDPSPDLKDLLAWNLRTHGFTGYAWNVENNRYSTTYLNKIYWALQDHMDNVRSLEEMNRAIADAYGQPATSLPYGFTGAPSSPSI